MLEVLSMEKKDIAEAIRIWGAQFYRYCHCDDFPDFFDGGKEIIKKYLLRQIKKETPS